MAPPLAQTITSSTGLELGLVLAMAAGLLALGGWSAILRHRQDEHGRTLRRNSRRLEELERDRTARDAVKAYKAGRKPEPSRPRPGDSTPEGA